MRYTYTVFGDNGCRLDINTRIEECVSIVRPLMTPWHIEVFDNTTNTVNYILSTIDQIEEWQEVLARAIWLDKPVPAQESVNPWRPFDEQETGIHLTSKEEAFQLATRSLSNGATNEKITCTKPLRAPLSILSNITDGCHPTSAVEYIRNVKLPDANLKTAAAVGKAPFQAVPPIAYVALGKAMQNGEDKYERFNWRNAGATSSVFFNAMMRHLLDWYSGEDHAGDSKVHHLAHLMAGCAIVLDAELHGKLNDDRPQDEVKLVEDMMKLILDK